jgi:hypothetical protein
MNVYLQPWTVSATDFPEQSYASDQLEFLLGYAILAPSPCNTQPWLFRINAMDVELFADRRRTLCVRDPEGRELTVSCGAALFNLRVATEYFGHLYKIETLPDPSNPDLLARFHLGLQGETSSEDILLFYAVPQRRTNRQAFYDKPVPETVLNALETAAWKCGAWLHVIRDESTRLALAELVAEADRRLWGDRRFRVELARWSRAKPEERPDGLPVTTFGIKGWLSFAGPTLIQTFNRGKVQAATDREIVLHSPALAVLGTERDDVHAWLCAGQALQRLLLGARSEEVWASFFNQPIEVPDLRAQLAAAIGRDGYPQALFRLGYGPDALPTPRRSVRKVLIMHRTGTR